MPIAPLLIIVTLVSVIAFTTGVLTGIPIGVRQTIYLRRLYGRSIEAATQASKADATKRYQDGKFEGWQMAVEKVQQHAQDLSETAP